MLKIILRINSNIGDDNFAKQLIKYVDSRKDAFVEISRHEDIMPQDGDIYVVFGTSTAELPEHVGADRTLWFGCLNRSAVNAPLDALELHISGNLGKDHYSLCSDQKIALERKIHAVSSMTKLQYHISLDGGIGGLWQPRIPTGDLGDEVTKPSIDAKAVGHDEVIEKIGLTETHQARICTSTSIIGAFYGIYPNIAEQFEDPNIQYVDFFVYLISDYKESKVLDAETLTSTKLIWDAHLTDECNILSEARSTQLPFKVRFFTHNVSKKHTDARYHNWIHPFADPTQEAIYHSPKMERFTWVNNS